MSGALVWLDGRLVPESEARIPWDAPGLREGYGLFETIRVAGGRAFLAGCHAQRITDAAPCLGIDPWLHPRTMTRGIDRLVRDTGLREGAVRVYLLPTEMPACGTSRARYLGMVSSALPSFPASVHAVLATDLRDAQGPLVGLKTLSRAAETLLLAQAQARGADESLRRNLAGRVTEGTRTNVFVIEGTKLITPPLDEGLLAGITRWFLLRIAKDAGFTPVEEPVSVERLLAGDEACLTSTLRGVVSLVSVDGHPIGAGMPGPKSALLRQLLEKHVARP